MNLLIIIAISSLFLISCGNSQMDTAFKGKQVTFTSSDGVEIVGDLYEVEEKEAPLILLFHQAGYSRGEYRPIAPKLNKLGFNCLAIDQRSGKEVNGVVNETHRHALDMNKGTEYVDAVPDFVATIEYAKGHLTDDIILWGSSYSASMVFYLAAKYPNEIKGILAFSPGEYFKLENQSIQSFAARVTCPVFITSARNEHENWKDIYDSITSEKYFYLPKKKGFHGSKALWPENEGHEECWKEVESFLMKVKE